MTGTSPPGPFRCGSTTCKVNAVAAAVSNAFPPFSSVAIPTAVPLPMVASAPPQGASSLGRGGNKVGASVSLAHAVRLSGADLSGQSPQQDGVGWPDLLSELVRAARTARPRRGDRSGRCRDRNDRRGRQGQGAQRNRILGRLRRG